MVRRTYSLKKISNSWVCAMNLVKFAQEWKHEINDLQPTELKTDCRNVFVSSTHFFLFTAYFSLKHNCVDYKRSRWYFEQHLDLKWWHTHTSYSIYSELLISPSTFTETKNLQHENCAIWWGEPTPLRKFQTIELVWWIWQNSLVVKI
jgi:hypothetical protein